MTTPLEQERNVPILNPFSDKSLLSAELLTPENLSWLSQLRPVMEVVSLSTEPSNLLKGRVMVCLFSEAPIETQLSWQAAMIRLGGDVLLLRNLEKYSSLAAEAKIGNEIDKLSQEQIGDIIVIHHPEVSVAEKAAEAAHVPVINTDHFNDDIYRQMALIAAVLVEDLTPQTVINSVSGLQSRLPL